MSDAILIAACVALIGLLTWGMHEIEKGDR